MQEKTGILTSKTDCVSCHMPSRKARLADDFRNLPKRDLNHHYWTGGGIPKTYRGFARLLRRGYQSGLGVEIELPRKIRLGEKNRFAVFLKNERAGHDLPTGDPERHLLVILRLIGPKNRVLSKASYRIGQIWQWNPAKKIADNRLRYGERRRWEAELLLPKKQIRRLELHVIHIKLTLSNFRHMRGAHSEVAQGSFPEFAAQLKHAEYHYPAAAWVHRSDFRLLRDSKKGAAFVLQRRWTTTELLRLSATQQKIRPEDRLYWSLSSQ